MISENAEIIEANDHEQSRNYFTKTDHEIEFRIGNISSFFKDTRNMKSKAAILKSAQVLDETFTFREALRSLEQFRYNASFTVTSLRDWQNDWLPLIAVQNDGSALIVTEIEHGAHCVCVFPGEKRILQSKFPGLSSKQIFRGTLY